MAVCINDVGSVAPNDLVSPERLLLEMHPALRLLPSGPEVYLRASHNLPLLESLYSQCQVANPEAGERYWSTRVWTLLIWQPAYLAVAAVHGMSRSVDFSCLQQSVSQSSVHGFFLQDDALLNVATVSSYCESMEASESWRLLLATAESLCRLVNGLFSELSSICKLNRTNSYGLVADALLSGLMALYRALPGFKHVHAVIFGRLWCHFMKLEDRHGVAVSQLEIRAAISDGSRSDLFLKRKSCCRHYLVDPGNLCLDCPLQKCGLFKKAPSA